MTPWPATVPTPRPVAAVVLTAMDVEAQPFLDALPRTRAPHPAPAPSPAESWSLRLPGPSRRELVLVRTGIGLVNAASALASVLAEVCPDVVLSAGTTGGLARGVAVGDVVASRTLAYADADATAFGYLRGQVPGMPVTYQGDPATLAQVEAVSARALAGTGARLHNGQMLAGSSFVTADNVAGVREAFPEAVSTDMESTALAQVCASRGLPFVSVRGVSDLCGPQAGEDFHIGADVAAARSAAVVLALLDQEGI